MGRVINANDIFIHPLKTIAKMKKILFAIMALAISTCAFALGQRREFKPEDMAKRQADRIKETCKTNEKQDAIGAGLAIAASAIVLMEERDV